MQSGLVELSEIKEEISSSDGIGSAVDLAAQDTFNEVKHRIGNGIVPDEADIGQVDASLDAAMEARAVVEYFIWSLQSVWICSSMLESMEQQRNVGKDGNYAV